MPFEIHSVDFRQNYTTPQAKRWLKKHDLQPIKRVHITKKDGVITSRRYRIKDPSIYKSFITKKVDNGNINLILGNAEEQQGTGIIQNIKDFITGRPTEMFPPQIRKFIQEHGASQIGNVMVCRKPIVGAIQSLMNIVSLGSLNKKMKEANIDKLRHLYVVLHINGKDYMFEKDEVIKVQPYHARPGQETLPLGQPKNNKTVAELFNDLIKQDPNINIYDSIKANCQGFVSHVLRVLGLWDNPETVKFVRQPTDKILAPYVQRINKVITNTGRRFNVLLEGKGRKNKHCVLCRKHC